MPAPRITLTIERDGAPAPRIILFAPWVVRAIGVAALALGVALLLGVAAYIPVIRTAARVPALQRDVARLEAENARVRELVTALDSLERRYQRLRGMLGADLMPDPVELAAPLMVAPAVRAGYPGAPRPYELGPSVPSHWPILEPGFVTRGRATADSATEEHTGLDIAVGEGTPVRAAGGGTVTEARPDKEYGLLVIIAHPQGYETLYGHLARLIAVPGQRVSAGEVIALSGNTGRSSAPHLHFEIRKDGAVLDPATLVREGR